MTITQKVNVIFLVSSKKTERLSVNKLPINNKHQDQLEMRNQKRCNQLNDFDAEVRKSGYCSSVLPQMNEVFTFFNQVK